MFNVDNLIDKDGDVEEDKTKLKKVYSGEYKEYMTEKQSKMKSNLIV